MLTRSIDLDDPFDLSIEEKLFYNAKRVCACFAVAAVTISGLDLMNIRPLESAAEFVHAHHDTRMAEWPGLIRSGIQQISLNAPASATVAIPRDFAMASRSAPSFANAKTDDSAGRRSRRRASAGRGRIGHGPAGCARPGEHRGPGAPRAGSVAAVAPRDSRQEIAASAPPPANSGAMQLASVDPNALPQSIAPQAAVIPVSLPARIGVLPPRAPGLPPESPAQRLHLEGKERAKAERCLADAIYFEARDQPYQGQVAVAQVVINRVFSGVYPHDVCGVIYQNSGRHLGCQFTFACDGKRKTINEFGSWARARRIARETLDGQLYVQAVGTSTHYHATYVHPNWVHEMHRLAREGVHLFYRPIAWGNGSDEPIWSRAQLAANKQGTETKKR